MYVGVLKIKIKICEAFNLKDKRRVIKSTFDKVSKIYNFSCAEVENLDIINLGSLGFSCVSNSHSHLEERLDQLIKFLDDDYRFEIINLEREIINVNY